MLVPSACCFFPLYACFGECGTLALAARSPGNIACFGVFSQHHVRMHFFLHNHHRTHDILAGF